MSLQVVKPFPLQFEGRPPRGGGDRNYGYPAPPSDGQGTRQAALAAAQAKLKDHYLKLGFAHEGEYMLRWNGMANPSLSQARSAPSGARMAEELQARGAEARERARQFLREEGFSQF
jgi:hypothetical protein|mmetsp:Transcript_24011/g.64968  ORF Transcript_24011/g.64968 Transcript_24011/m.64968 type:complete len:117 (-) Transcript_24011:127-477(-)